MRNYAASIILHCPALTTTPNPTKASTTTENTASTTTDSTASTTTTSTASTTTTSTASTSQQSTSSTTESTPSSTTMQSTTGTTDGSSSTTVISTTMSSTTGNEAVPPTITSIVDPQLSNNISGASKDDASGGLSTVAKIVIAAAVSGAILVAIIAVLWHCRYRRKNREPEPTGNYQPSTILGPPITPSSPLMTPSPSYLGRDGAPLTPPPRLQERRLLPSSSSEQLVERGGSRLRQGFHLPTGSRANLNSPYGSAVSPAFAMAAVVSGERQPSAPQSANRVGTPHGSPTRSQFARISYASSLADPGPPPDRELPTTPARVATAQSRSRSRPDVSPNAIGVALAFPPKEDDLSAQASNESGQSSESKIMTGPMRGSWGENRVVSGSVEAPAQLAPRKQTTRRTSRSPILEEQELARMAGSY
ncbi:hypothetical protein BBAD15_g5524 [Beauveria bassiana D1-5]|uniref:Uncharacterized protein n=1 Tax=Beauveria bassiana D1-5 TaxID=1245745 RepID=A0A0A2VMM5_BEABA|nr:hypothetical protein BBAD15_g5524 [Beauveria bassiana D1-5]